MAAARDELEGGLDAAESEWGGTVNHDFGNRKENRELRKAFRPREKQAGKDCDCDRRRRALHGAPSQKLLYDLATATADFSAAIAELNAAYALRDSKAPLRVPPVENYVELFRKNAAAKRASAGRCSPRRSRGCRRGTAAFLYTLNPEAISDSQKFANSLAAGLQRLAEKRPAPELPEPVTLTEKIASIERQINLAKAEIAHLDEQLRPVRRARAASRLGERTREKKEISPSSNRGGRIRFEKGKTGAANCEHKAARRESGKNPAQTQHR